MNNITIIGGGLSGTLVALNLLKNSTDDNVSIKLVDRGNEKDLGPAYSTDEDYLLNVPAGMMGAVSNEPEHFCKWLESRGIYAGKTDFLPRKLYRKYIQELFRSALLKKKKNITFERIEGEASDIKKNGSSIQVFLSNGKNFATDKLVLALGNFPPRNPPLKNGSFINSPFYVQNPWTSGVFSSLSSKATVFFIGTGQTMVDLAIGLHKHEHKGKMFAISRRGLIPLAHNAAEAYPSFYGELKNLKSVLEMFSIIRNHIAKAESEGLDRRTVIDSMRPYTQEIWMNLPAEEKRKFLRHLFRYWEIIRSRIPQESDELIKQMRAAGQLNIIAGRISDIIVKEKSVEVSYFPRYTVAQKIQTADIVVNCIGPELDYTKIQNPLVKNLISRGLIQPDPINLGINALPDGRIIHKDGTVSNVFFTIGLPLRGILWETLAAPEIRVQAENLAKLLLKNTN